MSIIINIHARQILDSRGNPTVEVDVITENGEVLDVVTLKAEQTKGQTRGRVFLGKKVRKQLGEYFSKNQKLHGAQELPLFYSQKGGGFTAQTVINLFAMLYKKALITGASSHSGRRSYLTKLSEQGVNPRVIQKLARHSSLNTTMVYIETNDVQLSRAADLAIV